MGIEDRLELEGLRKITYQPSDEGVLQNFKTEASQLVQKWDKFIEVIETENPGPNIEKIKYLLSKGSLLNVYIFQRIALSSLTNDQN